MNIYNVVFKLFVSSPGKWFKLCLFSAICFCNKSKVFPYLPVFKRKIKSGNIIRGVNHAYFKNIKKSFVLQLFQIFQLPRRGPIFLQRI